MLLIRKKGEIQLKKQKYTNEGINDYRIMSKDEKYPNQNNYRGDSLNEHHSIETANIIISENEIGQQNENL